MKLSYDQWLSVVDGYCYRLAGCSVHDLADCCFADWYADGMRPLTAAKRAIRAELGCDE